MTRLQSNVLNLTLFHVIIIQTLKKRCNNSQLTDEKMDSEKKFAQNKIASKHLNCVMLFPWWQSYHP